MKRKITAEYGGIKIVATIDTSKCKKRSAILNILDQPLELTRNEVEEIRDELADSFQSALSGLSYVGTYRNRVKVC